MEFNKEQRRAITADGNIIVSAGAGCGKTATMIERIVNKLKSGAELDRMLIVTFTRAAAADIRVKLAERLNKLKNERAEYREIAERAIDAMSVSDIGTLHGYCQKLIKTYFYAAGIDPSASVADDAETHAILESCIRAAIDDALDGGDDDFLKVYDMLASRREDAGVRKAVRVIIEFALSLPDTREYLTRVRKDSDYFGALDELVKNKRKALIERRDGIKEEAVRNNFALLIAPLEEVEDFLDGKIDFITSTKYTPKKTEEPADVAAKKEINAAFKKLKTDCAKFLTYRADAEKAKTRDSAPLAAALQRVALVALDLYDAKKAALGKLDYSDLEHGAERILSDSSCRAEIAKSIDYVFIDEYQDVNPLQAAIAEHFRLCGAEMFLVGDVKQSIYGFRRCSPEFFKKALTDENYTAVYLTENYRSSKRVIDFVNGIFSRVMTEKTGGADYSENMLVCTSAQEGNAAFYEIADEKTEDSDDGEPYSVMSAGQKTEIDPEAKFVADLVIDRVEQLPRGKKGEESGLNEIAVLVRGTKGAFVGDLVNILSASGIPCNVCKKSYLSDFPHAAALVDIARYIDNRFDDMGLYTALRSSMGGFSDEEILEIAKVGEKKISRPFDKNVSLCQKVAAYSGKYDASLKRFTAMRDEFSLYSKCHSASETLGYITSRTDYFRSVCAVPSAAAAVEALIELADRFVSLKEFLDYCADGKTELSVAADDDAVTITTIHSSKGLEYDHVIVANAGREFNLHDLTGKIIVCNEGVMLKAPDFESGELELTAPYIVAAAEGKGDVCGEELRLFYVALTRAKKDVVVCGKTPSRRSSENYSRYLDFMRGTPRDEYKPERGQKAETETAVTPVDPDAVYTAVKRACDFDYGARKLYKDPYAAKSDGLSPQTKAELKAPIKTCVTAVAAASGEDGDYTSGAAVLTVDDREKTSDTSKRKKAKDGAIDPCAVGNAYHKAMELIDFADPDIGSVQNIEGFEYVDFDDIARAAAAMNKLAEGSTHIFRERYFIIDVDYAELYETESKANTKVLVQGVIDLLIVRPNGTAIVVDYKTTAPDRLDCPEYRTQLRLYAKAVEKSTPYKVIKKYLYSFKKGLIEL